MFKSRCKVVVCTLVVMLFVSTGVFASRVELGANVMKGSLRISDHWLYGRINNDMSFLSFAGKVALTTNLELEVEHMFGKAELAEPDDYGINFYGYTNTKLGGKLKLSDSVSILIGYSRYLSQYDSYYSSGYTLENQGGGFKVGFEAVTPATKGFSASVRYAFLPFVYTTTFELEEDGEGVGVAATEEEYEYDDYVGTGHELKARLRYVFNSGLGLELGYVAEVYNGVSSCCNDYFHEPAGVSSIYAGLNFAF
ncbi:MAG: hypothetical protein M0Q40_07350 [Limnochordia bacterium]|nr:hypothetical protein [Limnochordia bacterium]MDD4518078.1 hypothetical protein [Limnochordia bacterium]